MLHPSPLPTKPNKPLRTLLFNIQDLTIALDRSVESLDAKVSHIDTVLQLKQSAEFGMFSLRPYSEKTGNVDATAQMKGNDGYCVGFVRWILRRTMMLLLDLIYPERENGF